MNQYTTYEGRTNMDQMPYANNADLSTVQPQDVSPSTTPPYVSPATAGEPAVYPATLPASVQQPVQRNGVATASLVLGIISIIAWLLPILGLPLSIIGVVLGHLGRRLTVRRGRATTGLVLSYIALGLTVLNAIAGVMLAMHLLVL
jgi:hypothetical protein